MLSYTGASHTLGKEHEALVLAREVEGSPQEAPQMQSSPPPLAGCKRDRSGDSRRHRLAQTHGLAPSQLGHPCSDVGISCFWGQVELSPEYHLPFCHLSGGHYMPTHLVALGDPEAGHDLVDGHVLHALGQQVHPLLDGGKHVLALFVLSDPAATDPGGGTG